MAGWSLAGAFVLRHAGFPFDWIESLGMSAAALDQLRELPTSSEGRATAELTYVCERARLRARLHELAQERGVQEAVFLSSPDMFENVWERYAKAPLRAESSDARRVERQVYAYLQRLCAKNETTSFFGPMGQGDIEDGDGDTVEFLPAAPQRRTFIAYWAVEALASRAAMEPELWPSLELRRNPLFSVGAAEARSATLGKVVPLSGDEWRLLGAVDACPRAEALAAQLGRPLEAVEKIAWPLFQAGVLVRRLWFRSDQPDTLGNLRAALAELPASDARARWLDRLAAVERLRAQFEGAPFDERRELLPRLEALFSDLAGVPARRAGGRLYTDRLVINEEASSSFRLRIGGAAARKLAAALSPLLEMAAAHGKRFQERCVAPVHDWLEQAGGVDFAGYAAGLRDLRVDAEAPTLVEDGGAVQQLAPALRGQAGAGSRFALPDVCLGRRADGSLHAVLARMHHQLLTRSWLFTFHPQPERADAGAARCLRREPVTLAELATGRHNKGHYSFPGPRIAYAIAELQGRGHPVLAAADLEVALEEGQPILRAPDGSRYRLYLPLADLTVHPPFAALTSPPALLPRFRAHGPHTSRLDVGAATLQRETFRLETAGWDKLSPFALFTRLQEEKRRLGLPRFCFARVPSERKPFLLDADSPFAAELLRHHARGAEVHLEEMLPRPEELWLRDERGRYTFELRMQAERDW
jgi:hypothetical protein